ERCRHRPNLSFLQADIRKTGLPDSGFDYTWSQFVFQYLPDRMSALRELIRVTRPGGKVVVSEIDGLGFHNWPFPEAVREKAQRMEEALSTRGFDLYVGRKLFSEFLEAGLREVRVHLFPFYVVAGVADSRMLADWETRFAALESVVAPALGGQEAYQEFCRSYLDMLTHPKSLKYAVMLVTEGVKP
ncbi:MAG: methyltransferase domain-containing protein, partial [Archangium sp.]